jgi:predicted kinase
MVSQTYFSYNLAMVHDSTIRTVIVGIGVPGSGKTTHLKLLAESNNMTYINPDDIREELTGDARDHSLEEQVWQTVYRQIGLNVLERDVVIDATYTRKRDRRELIDFCKSYRGVRIIGVWFNFPLEISIARNKLRQRVVPESVIKKMYNRLDINPPTIQEGFDEVIQIND